MGEQGPGDRAAVAMAPVDFTLGDFRTEDWSGATLVVAMSLCFPEELLLALEEQALQLRPGARLVVMHDCFGDMLQRGGCVHGCESTILEPLAQSPALRPVCLRDVHPRHAVPTEMSFGEAQLYVF